MSRRATLGTPQLPGDNVMLDSTAVDIMAVASPLDRQPERGNIEAVVDRLTGQLVARWPRRSVGGSRRKPSLRLK